ncbi:MAG TPA: hypothetical protein VKT77_05150, partial [Chthonomonadaceae bacterium]|nr:hypothetical protein [Chthonomonadaceae bacterium]
LGLLLCTELRQTQRDPAIHASQAPPAETSATIIETDAAPATPTEPPAPAATPSVDTSSASSSIRDPEPRNVYDPVEVQRR